MTNAKIVNREKSYHRFEIGLSLFGFCALVLSGIGMIDNPNWIVKTVLGIICLDSFYLFWCTLQDFYFNMKRKFVARKSYDYES